MEPLTAYTVGFISLAAFKRSIETVDFSEFLKCRPNHDT